VNIEKKIIMYVGYAKYRKRPDAELKIRTCVVKMK